MAVTDTRRKLNMSACERVTEKKKKEKLYRRKKKSKTNAKLKRQARRNTTITTDCEFFFFYHTRRQRGEKRNTVCRGPARYSVAFAASTMYARSGYVRRLHCREASTAVFSPSCTDSGGVPARVVRRPPAPGRRRVERAPRHNPSSSS